jgi:hypothetical protein
VPETGAGPCLLVPAPWERIGPDNPDKEGTNVAQALVLEFDQIGGEDYRRVNEKLGISVETGEGNWPDGLLFHAGATKPGGGLVVFEIWESQEAQSDFMNGALGSALQAAGVSGPPTKVEWLNVEAYQSLGS